MSKAQMARELVQLGSTRSFNTLRKLPTSELADMLQTAQLSGVIVKRDELVPLATIAPPVPTDTEIRRAAYASIPVATMAPANVPESRLYQWVMLAAQPIMILRGMIGV